MTTRLRSTLVAPAHLPQPEALGKISQMKFLATSVYDVELSSDVFVNAAVEFCTRSSLLSLINREKPVDEGKEQGTRRIPLAERSRFTAQNSSIEIVKITSYTEWARTLS